MSIMLGYRGERRKEGTFGLGPRSPKLTQNSLELCTGTLYWSSSGRLGNSGSAGQQGNGRLGSEMNKMLSSSGWGCGSVAKAQA